VALEEKNLAKASPAALSLQTPYTTFYGRSLASQTRVVNIDLDARPAKDMVHAGSMVHVFRDKLINRLATTVHRHHSPCPFADPPERVHYMSRAANDGLLA
jgi:hypothetical protein